MTKTPKPLEPMPPTLLATDPGLRGTGWAILNLRTWRPIALGVVVTKSASDQKKAGLRQSVAEADLRSGLEIFDALTKVMAVYRPLMAAQEGNAGSKSVSAAAGLARAQQACGDAIYRFLRATPIMRTVQSVKKSATGTLNASKDDIEKAVRSLWPHDDLDSMLRAEPVYASYGHKPPSPGKWENAFDALAVAHSVKDHPSLVAFTKFANAV